jgi:hypothetical protein
MLFWSLTFFVIIQPPAKNHMVSMKHPPFKKREGLNTHHFSILFLLQKKQLHAALARRFPTLFTQFFLCLFFNPNNR